MKPMSTEPPSPPADETLRLERFLPYRLNVVGFFASRALGRIYGEHFGIGIPEWRVIAQLGEFGKLTSRDIGELAQMHKTKVSRAVTELERRGLVSRAENRQDRREAFVALTAAGKRVYDADRAAGAGLRGALDRGDSGRGAEGVRARALDPHRTRPPPRRRLSRR